MTPDFAHWFDVVKERGARILVVVAVVVILNRLSRAFTSRMIVPAKTQTRVAQGREYQTRTMAGVLYSMATKVIVIVAIPAVAQALTALQKCAAEIREDPAWSPLLVDGPNVLGAESLALTGTTIRCNFAARQRATKKSREHFAAAFSRK